MKRMLLGVLAAASVLTLATPAMAATAYPIGPVNVRSGPGTQNAILTTLSEGEKAAVLAHEGNWLKVRTSGGITGYMADWVTREVFDDAPAYLTVTADVLNIRAQPDAESTLVGRVVEGDRLRLLDGLGGWYRVDIGVLGTGWVKSEYTYRQAMPPATAWPTPPPEPPVTELPRAGLVKTVQAIRATSIYNGRSTQYSNLGAVRAWENLTYLDAAEGWVKVKTGAGKTGWIDGAAVQLADQGTDFARQALYGMREGDWSMRLLKVREVVPGGTGLALRTAAAADAGVVSTLPEGARMKLLEIPGGDYVKAMLPDGATGWVSRNWIKPVAGLPEESVRLWESSKGVLRLEVAGPIGAVQAGPDSLTVALPENAARLANLKVAQFGVASMALEAKGLTVRFDGAFRHQILSNNGTSLLLEIRPVVEQVQAQIGPDREIYRMQVGGLVEPAVRREGAYVAVDLPGARLAPGLMLPAGVLAQADAGGVTLRVLSDRAFALKRNAGVFDLVLLAPGLAGKTIVVDAGHGGIESGAVGPTGLSEKEANLGISLKLKTMLEAAGARVIMTRTADTRCASPEELLKLPTFDEKLYYDLGCRATTSDTVGADAFVSIHNNASPDRSVRGTETYWSLENLNASRSQALAALVQEELVAALGLRNLGVKRDIFYVTKYTDAPAILTEIAFLSNPTEEALLRQDSFRQKTAEAIFKGLSRLWN